MTKNRSALWDFYCSPPNILLLSISGQDTCKLLPTKENRKIVHQTNRVTQFQAINDYFQIRHEIVFVGYHFPGNFEMFFIVRETLYRTHRSGRNLHANVSYTPLQLRCHVSTIISSLASFTVFGRKLTLSSCDGLCNAHCELN